MLERFICFLFFSEIIIYLIFSFLFSFLVFYVYLSKKNSETEKKFEEGPHFFLYLSLCFLFLSFLLSNFRETNATIFKNGTIIEKVFYFSLSISESISPAIFLICLFIFLKAICKKAPQ